MKAIKAEMLLLVITVVWGVTFTFTKIGLESTTPFFYVFMRFTIAFTISFIIWGKYLFRIDKTTAYRGAVLGLFMLGGFIFQTLGLKLTSVSKSAFITGMSVLFTPFIFRIIEKKKVEFWQKMGVLVAFLGLWLFTNPKWDMINVGDVFTLVSTFFWAFYITYMDIYTKDIKTFETTMQNVFMQFIVTAPGALIASLLFEGINIQVSFNSSLILSLLYNGIVASVFLTIIHTSVQKYTTPVKAALIFSLEPVFATVVAILAMNEILSGREYFGAFVLFLGVIVAETGETILNKLFVRNS